MNYFNNNNLLPMYITGPCGNASWVEEWANSGITSWVSSVTGWIRPSFNLQMAAIGESNWWLHNTTSASVEPWVLTAATRPLGMDTRRLQSVNMVSSSTEHWPLPFFFKTSSKKLTSCCPTEKFHLKEYVQYSWK